MQTIPSPANSFIVTFKVYSDDATKQDNSAINHIKSQQLHEIWSTPSIKKVDPLAWFKVRKDVQQDQQLLNLVRPNDHESSNNYEHSFIVRVDFEHPRDAAIILSEWQKNNRILFYEPNHLNDVFSSKTKHETSLPWYPKDTITDPLWWQKQIKYFQGLKYIGKKFDEVKEPPLIAVLDSGVDYLHPALKDQIWTNPQPGKNLCGYDHFGCNTTVTTTSGKLGTPYVHPLLTTAANEECPQIIKANTLKANAQCSHGTHVAGIIAGNPHKGVAGICPFCKLMILKIVEDLEGSGQVSDSSILKALQYIYLIKKKGLGNIRIINSSFGKFEHSKTISLFLKKLQSPPHDILVVAAAGNENTTKPIFPAALNTTISVTALDAEGKKAPYANYGYWVDIAAPGGFRKGILSAFPGQRTGLSQGTSVATPIVTGILGLLLAINPQFTSKELRNILLNTADKNLYSKNYARGFNHQHFQLHGSNDLLLLGQGVVDVEAAVYHTLYNTEAKYQNPKKKRITPNCGSVIVPRVSQLQVVTTLILFMFLLMPVALISLIR